MQWVKRALSCFPGSRKETNQHALYEPNPHSRNDPDADEPSGGDPVRLITDLWQLIFEFLPPKSLKLQRTLCREFLKAWVHRVNGHNGRPHAWVRLYKLEAQGTTSPDDSELARLFTNSCHRELQEQGPREVGGSEGFEGIEVENSYGSFDEVGYFMVSEALLSKIAAHFPPRLHGLQVCCGAETSTVSLRVVSHFVWLRELIIPAVFSPFVVPELSELLQPSQLPWLQVVDLSGRHFDEVPWAVLGRHTGLTDLSLQSCREFDPTKAEALTSLTRLTRLDVSMNPMTTATASVGVPFLRGLTNLTELNTFHSGLRGSSVTSTLGTLTQLTSLSMGGHELAPEDLRALTSLVSLVRLDVSPNPYGAPEGVGGVVVGELGAESLASLPRLVELSVAQGKLGDAGMRRVCQQLTSLRRLDVSGCELGPEGVVLLPLLRKLHSLNLTGNKLGPSGAQSLGRCTQLQELWVGENQLGRAGAQALASSLHRLTRLDISKNALGSEGTGSLTQLTSLTFLAVQANLLQDEGLHRLRALTC